MPERVLLVTAADDLARAAGALVSRGDDVTYARDGGSAVEAVERVHPDVVVWDGELTGDGGGRGGEISVARLQATGAGVVVVSGAAGGGLPAAIRAFREGAEQLVVRPVDPELLVAAVERAAEAGRWRRAAEEIHRPRTLADVEREQVERALRHHAGNRTRAARELGISRATLINKIRAYALDL